MKKILLGLLIVVIISNLPFMRFLTLENYSYRNFDGSFTYSEEGGKGKSFIGCQRLYAVFLYSHPEKDQGDNRLFRTFTVKPWRFWEWGEMIFHSDRFLLPYKGPPDQH